MFCKNCGENIPDHVKFCPNCGTPKEEPAEENIIQGSLSETIPPTESFEPPNPKPSLPPDHIEETGSATFAGTVPPPIKPDFEPAPPAAPPIPPSAPSMGPTPPNIPPMQQAPPNIPPVPPYTTPPQPGGPPVPPKPKKKKKVGLIITLTLLFLILAFGVCVFFVNWGPLRYMKGLAMNLIGQRDQAISAFSDAKDFGSAKQKLKSLELEKAKELENQKKYSEALAIYKKYQSDAGVSETIEQINKKIFYSFLEKGDLDPLKQYLDDETFFSELSQKDIEKTVSALAEMMKNYHENDDHKRAFQTLNYLYEFGFDPEIMDSDTELVESIRGNYAAEAIENRIFPDAFYLLDNYIDGDEEALAELFQELFLEYGDSIDDEKALNELFSLANMLPRFFPDEDKMPKAVAELRDEIFIRKVQQFKDVDSLDEIPFEVVDAIMFLNGKGYPESDELYEKFADELKPEVVFRTVANEDATTETKEFKANENFYVQIQFVSGYYGKSLKMKANWYDNRGNLTYQLNMEPLYPGNSTVIWFYYTQLENPEAVKGEHIIRFTDNLTDETLGEVRFTVK